MSLRTLFTVILASGPIALMPLSSVSAGPRIAGGELNLQATAAIAETSRVSPRADSSSDTFYTLTPAVSYTRDSNIMDLQGSLSVAMRRYDSNGRLDSDSLNVNLGGEIPLGAGPRLSGNWNFAYFDGIQSSYLTNRNLDSETLSFNAYANYVLRNQLSFRARAGYSDRSSGGIDSFFVNDNQSTQFAAGFHARELIRGRIGLYVEYLIRERETNRGLIGEGVNDTDDGINFGITGQILPERLFPKLDADLSFGFTSTSGSDRLNSGRDPGRQNRLTLDGRLAYPANAKTDVILTVNRSLQVTDDDQTVERSAIDLSLSYNPQPRLGFSASIGLSSNDFVYAENNRNDDVFTTNLSARYVIRQNWSASLSLSQRDSSSNLAISDYDTTLVSLSTTVSF